MYGIRGVAAPIHDASHDVVASFGISGYASQTPISELSGILARHVKDAAAAVSADLGYRAERAQSRLRGLERADRTTVAGVRDV